MNAAALKEEIRRHAAEAVAALGPEVRRTHDSRIVASLLASPHYQNAGQVFAYSALSDEVSLRGLAERCHADRKRFLLPVVSQADVAMSFRTWADGEPLRKGFGGVTEPTDGEGPTDEASVIIVPGRAFDARGGRVGRGQGCYDRAMDELATRGPLIGVAYACQVVPRISLQAHDRRVEFLLTEEGLLQAAA